LTLEFRATIKQLKLIEAFRWQFELIEYIWKASGLSGFEYLELEYKFTRNIPMELKESGEIVGSLKGLVSDQTLLETIPIVTDVKKEMERIEDEREEIDLEDPDASELE
jgi:SPP1 family phage portal protein